MADDVLLTITLKTVGSEYRADLHAPSGGNGKPDLRLDGISANAIDAVEICLAELQARAADGDEVALRFC